MPMFIVAFEISKDLGVNMWHNNILLLTSKFEFLLGKEGKCLYWKALESLFSHLNGFDISNVSINDKLSSVIKLLQECSDECKDNNLTEKLS